MCSLIAQLVKNLPAMQEIPGSIPGSGRSAGEGMGYPLEYSWASLVAGEESACNAGYLGSIHGLGRSPGEWKGHPSSVLSWRIHGVCSTRGRKESDTTERLPLLFTLCVSCLVMSDSVTPWTAGHQALSPWNSPGKNTGVGCRALLQWIFPT